MIGLLVLKLMERGLSPKLAKAGAWAIIVIAIIAALSVAKCSYDRDLIADHDAQVTEQTLTTDTKAKAEAAERRAIDIIAIEKAEKERNDEIARAAPGRPSDAAVRLGCERLRQAGQATGDIAACR